MRELKFRGINKYGHFVYGFLTTNGEFDSVIEDFVEFNPTMQDPCGGVGRVIDIVKRESVGQFTGLQDKNGVDIYEGDILGYEYDGESFRTGPVEYEAKFGCYAAAVGLGVTYPEDVYCQDEYPDVYTIIGNIYENPELLEKPE
jgi:uncharacterized phage protein (TIGR01671 family)